MYAFMVVLLGGIAFVLVRGKLQGRPSPAGLRGRIRARGWGLLLLPAALMAAAMTGHVRALAVAEVAAAGALVLFALRLAAKVVPYAVLALAGYGLILAKNYHDAFNNQALYGDGFNNQVLYGLVLAGGSSWRTRLVLPEAGLFFVLGVGLLLKVNAPVPGWSGC